MAATPAEAKDPTQHVRPTHAGLVLNGRSEPILAGSVHYWRMAPSSWAAALQAVKSLGLNMVDTYVPWSVHERSEGEFEFGATDPRRNVAAFVRLAGELGLSVIARPGPHINAELTHFGIPERVIWNEHCQARSARGKKVILPAPPLAFPVPSYASRAFRGEVQRWFEAVGEELAALRHPRGPIVLIQIDNEGALYFRDGVYDQDYHPDAIAEYRAFLGRKYSNIENLRRAYASPSLSFSQAEPPRRFTSQALGELVQHLDWAEYQEHLLADALADMRRMLTQAGLGDVPTSHNLPISEGATPLDPALIGRAVDVVGLDYYHGASPPQRSEIARRTSALALRCEVSDTPAFACELGAGFPPFLPPLTDEANAFTALTALAYGLRGYNLYMAVDRDRWIGAPFSIHLERRPSAVFWEKLTRAILRLRLHELRRRTPVHIVVPRVFRRLVRVMHAFGPASAALFQALGGSCWESCLEDDFELGEPLALGVEQFMRRLEQELEAHRIPYAFSGEDLLEHSLGSARWLLTLSPGALPRHVAERLVAAAPHEAACTVGPLPLTRDEGMQPLSLTAPTSSSRVPWLLANDLEVIRQTVASARTELGLMSLSAEPAEVFVTLHVDDRDQPRVLFAVNPSEHDVEARLPALGMSFAMDAMDEETVRATQDRFTLRVRRRSVRMLELKASPP